MMVGGLLGCAGYHPNAQVPLNFHLKNSCGKLIRHRKLLHVLWLEVSKPWLFVHHPWTCASAPLQVWPLHVQMFQHTVLSCPAWSPIVLNHDCVVECRKPKLVICCKLEPDQLLYWCSHTYLGAQHLANVELHRHDPRPNRWARSRAWSATKCFSDTRSLAADSAGHLRRTTYSPVLPVLCRPVLLTATTSSDWNTQRMDA